MPPAIKCELLGCDLGKSLDYTSFAVIGMELDPKISDCVYHLKALDRIKGVDYPKITELIIKTVERLEQEMNLRDSYPFGGPILAMDTSGLGAPIKDFLKANHTFNTRGRKLYPVVFTGGESARFDPDTHNFNISKSLLISNFLSLMQRRRFDYSPDLQALPLLEEEITNFKYHLTPAGHTAMDAAAGKHDDLICAICIPLFISEWKFAKRLRR
jgi:hypothetical protein